LRATTPAADAALILKLDGAPDPRGWLDARLAALRAALGGPRTGAPICLVDERFADATMPRLFAAATHYISLSRGEGWDLPMVEAAAAGLRLIAPDHTAYKTYLDASCAQLVPSRPAPVAFAPWEEPNPLFFGAEWQSPDENAAVAAVRRAVDGGDGALEPPRERILQAFTWDRAARTLLASLAAAAPHRARRRWRPAVPWTRR
ncbi:MAG TPA: hypothetical protein VFU81_18835, partial [Thermomicrobiales bacterium]|nr:hypothetical protein [Thermomicrobiales bacterium]